MRACRYSGKYQGVKPPKCNSGQGCDACKAIYNLVDIGQEQKLPPEIWIIIDMDNGDRKTRRYCWWFETKRQALDFKEHHNKVYKKSNKYAVDIIGPFNFIRKE